MRGVFSIVVFKNTTAMEIITMESEAYKSLIDKIDKVYQEVLILQDPAKQIAREWCTTIEATKVLKCSPRTICTYKSKGILVPTTVNNKDYYELKDLKELLTKGVSRDLVIQKPKI